MKIFVLEEREVVIKSNEGTNRIDELPFIEAEAQAFDNRSEPDETEKKEDRQQRDIAEAHDAPMAASEIVAPPIGEVGS